MVFGDSGPQMYNQDPDTEHQAFSIVWSTTSCELTYKGWVHIITMLSDV